MARIKIDSVTPHLMRARAALLQENDTYLKGLLDEAIRHRAATTASGQLRSTLTSLDKRLVKALEHIHAHLGDRLSVTTIADAAASSEFHLARLFKAKLGCPPMKYAMKQRLELAREMLAYRLELRIVDIALESGFSSQSHLSVAFRKEYGVSPLAYRKNPAILP